MQFLVVRPADQKQRPRFRCRLPPRPRAVSFAEAGLDAQHLHQRRVKRQCAIEVGDTDKDMRKHRPPPLLNHARLVTPTLGKRTPTLARDETTTSYGEDDGER